MQSPPKRDLILIGGGHSHVYVLKDLGQNPIAGVQVTLIARDIETPYSGMLPGHVAGHYTREQVHIDLNKLARYAGARLIHASAVGLNRIERLVYCSDGRPPLRYDLCSIDVGCTPQFVPGKSPECLVHVTPVKPINGFSARWELILDRIRADRTHSSSRIVVVGGGAGGVELALSMQHRLKSELRASGLPDSGISVALISRSKVPMASHGRQAQRLFDRLLRTRGIELYLGSAAIEVIENECERGGTILLENGGVVHFDEVFWCTTSGAAQWFKSTGLDLGKDGFIQVGPTLQSTNDPAVFATGDCADMVASPRPKAGVFAVRQGPPLAHNLRAFLEQKRFMRFMPQKNFMCIIGVGGEDAVVVYGGHISHGAWAWRWKRRIDEQWIQTYQNIPGIERNNALDSSLHMSSTYIEAGSASVAALKGAQMRNGGYGSKIGPEILSKVLHSVYAAAAMNDVTGKAGASLRGPMQILLKQEDASSAGTPLKGKVHGIDLFRSHVTDPYIFGRIAANHALTRVHAKGLLPASALAITVLPHSGEIQAENLLTQLMAGALETFREVECDLVGGHTSEGSDLALGFAINTSVPLDVVTRKSIMQVGDKIIVTKAIGTGVLMAADMRACSKGYWIEQAIESMLQSSASAAILLRHYGATAITNVSVSGIACDLLEIIRASSVPQNDSNDEADTTKIKVQLQLDSIPLLHGALKSAAAGNVSSRHPTNQRSSASAITPASSFAIMIDAAATARRLDETAARDLVMAAYTMFFDPQTAGGLLATIPAEHANDCILALRGKGYKMATVIGEVVPSGGRVGEKEIIFSWGDESP